MLGDRLRAGTAALVRIPIPDADWRIAAILHDPAGYFAHAQRLAYQAASTELDAELEWRAQQRTNHPPLNPAHQLNNNHGGRTADHHTEHRDSGYRPEGQSDS
jgi:hypothetical protein